MGIYVSRYNEEAHKFLNAVAENMGQKIDENHAGRVTVSVLNALRDRISIEESFHLMSQLPMLLKGVYVDGWNISKERNKSTTVEEFLDEVRADTPRTAARDFGNNQQAKQYVKAVIKALGDYASDGQIRHIQEQLPPAIAELFEVGVEDAPSA